MSVTPLLDALIDNFVEALEGMSKDNGYNFDYGGVRMGEAGYDVESDLDRPTIYWRWDGSVTGNDLTGGESATGRFRLSEKIRVSCAFGHDGDNRPDKKARLFRADLLAALFADRRRGSTRTQTYYAGTEQIAYAQKGTEIVACVIDEAFYIRHDFRSGDMGSQ